MEAKKIYQSSRDQLKTLKSKFSEFLDVVRDIEVLHDLHIGKVNNGTNVDCRNSYLRDKYPDLELGAGYDINTSGSGNVPRDTNCLSDGANVNLGTKSTTGEREFGVGYDIKTSGYENVPRDTNYLSDGANVNLGTKSTTGSKCEFRVGYDINANVPRDTNYLSDGVNVNLGTKSTTGSEREFRVGYDINASVYENVMEDQQVTATHFNNHVMGVELPNESVFDDSRLQEILNKESQKSTLNYFYYLFGNSDAIDTFNYNLDSPTAKLIESAETMEEIIEQNNSLYIDSEETRDQATFTFGSTDEATGLGGVSTDSESSNVDVISLNHLSDVPVVRENVITSKHQPLSSDNTEKPCIDVKINHGCDNINMFVPTSDGEPKKYCCLYCLLRFSKLVPHLICKHKNEPDVKKIRNLAPGSKQRIDIIARIRNRGRFIWNTNGKINGGELSTCRRPNRKFKKTALDYKTCSNCFAALTGTCLSHHWNKCTNNHFKGERIAMELSRAVEGRLHADACEDLREVVFARMREDECIQSIRYDWLVITFGNDLCLNYDIELASQFGMICSKLRDSGKLLCASKSISTDISDFSSLYEVKHCNTVVEAIRKVTGFDSKSKKFESPSTASALVTLVNAIGVLLIVEINRKELDPTKVERFFTVFEKDARNKINKLVAKQKSKARRERQENIPSTQDVNQFATYLDGERDKCFNELTENYLYPKWLYLAQLTLASILSFNRRRTGESRYIRVNEFHGREMIAVENNNVPERTKEVIKSRMKIRGKLNRTVPVLLKHSYEDCINLLLRYRKDAGVPDKNPFLFALPSKSGKINTINACAVIKTLSESCGVTNHTSIRGTKLRKHLASFCSDVNLTDNDVTNLANFMGHDDQIHRDIYRHNTLEREVVQITTLLQAAQGNRKGIAGTSTGQKRKKGIDLTGESSSEDDETIAVNARKSTVKIVAAQSSRKRKLPVRQRDRSGRSMKKAK